MLKPETKKSKRGPQQSARSRKHSIQEQKSPKRLKSLYLARTPEAGMKTLKAELEAEIKHLLAIAPDTICKVILMDGARAIAKLPKSKQEQKHRKRNFFAANARRMNYAQYRQQGLPIGSGPVEAGCKTIVKARLCCSGMRWTRTRAQHVLRIRTMIKNNRWNVAWNQCKYAATKAQESVTN